jgi:hypothetical protein
MVAPMTSLSDRASRMLGSIDVATAKGLELGPLAKPVVPREAGNIRYLDHIDTEALRARYAGHDDVDIEAIVPVDYATGTGSVHDAVGSDAPFDYVVASHVIEHVPDIITWLFDLRSVIGDGGVLALAIPDHRRCFDALRSPTVTADLIHAHLTASTIPTPRQVFDHIASAVSWYGFIAWEEEPPFHEMVPVHSEPEAIARAAEISESGDYQDVHCWVFTPASFVRLIAALQRLHLVPFSLESCSETIGGEFFATLRAADVTTASVTPVLSSDVPGPASEHAALRAELAQERAENAVLRDELTRTVASRSWKVTRPLRAFNRVLARLR